MANALIKILEELEKKQQKKHEPKRSDNKKFGQTVLGQKTKEKSFWDKQPNNKTGDNLGQTQILGQNVGVKQLIEMLRGVRVRLLPINVSKNTVRRGHKKYTYIRKRVDLPNNYNEENVVVISPSDFLRIISVFSYAVEKAYGVGFDIEKVRKWLFEKDEDEKEEKGKEQN